jgi:amidohydrolase
VPDAPGNPVTFNHVDLTSRMVPSLAAVVGEANLLEPPLQMGAEDFSYYAKEVPGLFWFVGATSKGIDPAKAPSNHSPEFVLDEGALDVGLRTMLQATLDFLETPAS